MTETAAELRTVQLQVVAEDVEERRRGIDVDIMLLPVDRERDGRHQADGRNRMRFRREFPDESIPIRKRNVQSGIATDKASA